jgi:hypothetical protein
MKGFLNKVQRRVSGSGPSDGAPQAGAKAGDKPSTPITKQANRSNGVESTPKADVTLPRRERRYIWHLIFIVSICLTSV